MRTDRGTSSRGSGNNPVLIYAMALVIVACVFIVVVELLGQPIETLLETLIFK